MRDVPTAGLAALLLWTPAASAQTRPLPLDTLRVEVGARTLSVAPRATRAVQVLDRAFLEATPARSVGDLLAWALGVDVQARSTAQTDVEIRGASFEGVLVLVDGVRMSDTQTGHFDLDVAVPLAEIERIEILRGPASAQYGSDAVGGVVHIVTRRGSAVEVRAQGGSFGSVMASASAGGAGLRLGVEHDRSDGHRPGTDHDITQLRAGLDRSVTGGRVRVDAAFAARDFGAADFYAPFPSYEETRTLTLAAGWTGNAGPVVVEPRVHARRHSDDFILRRGDPGFYRNRHTTWQRGVELAGRIRLERSAVLAAGVEGVRDDIESNALGDRHETRGAAYAEVLLGEAEGTLVQLGARVDRHSAYGTFFAPSVAAGVRAHEALRLRGSVGRSFRAPGWTERYYEDPANVGTADLAPERAWSGEVGMTLALSATTSLDVAGFARIAESLIDWARPDTQGYTGPWRTMNVDDATFVGIEAALQGTWRAVRWSVGGTALSLDAEEQPGFVSKYALRPLQRSVLASLALPVASDLDVVLRARHARRTGEDAHTLLDSRVTWVVGGLRVYLDGTNLADAEYMDVSVQPAPGRAVRLGLAFTPAR